MQAKNTQQNIKILISVVTPSFNQGAFIEDTIRSVLSQDYPNVQHIVVDGGSTDGTVEILSRYRTKLEFISEPDNGQVDAILKGFARARGDIVTWLNSDDVYVYRNTLSRVAELFTWHPDASVISGSSVLIDSGNNLLQVYRAFPQFRLNQLMLYDYIRQPATFFRTNVLCKHNLDKTLECAFDYDLWLKLSQDFRFIMVKDIFAGIRRHGDMKTIRLAKAMAEESERVVAKYRDRISVSMLDRAVAPFLRSVNKIAGLSLIANIYQRPQCEYTLPIRVNSLIGTCLRQLVNHKGILF